MRGIELTQGLFSVVDDADYERLARHKWQAQPHHTGTFYAKRTVNLGSGKYITIRMHNFIMNTNQMIDHIDRDPLNNQRGNLRLVTAQQNAANSGPRGSVSGFKGVHTYSTKGKYQAQCKGKYLGVFADPVEAAIAYDRAAYALDGEYAYLNFPLHEVAAGD